MFMFFPIIPYVIPKLFTLFSIWFFIIDYLLINSFLILDKDSVDLILVHSLLFLLLYCFCIESLFQLLYHCSYSFFLYVILHFKFLIFFFPPFLFFLFIFTPTSFKANFFSYRDYSCFCQDIFNCKIFSSDML